MPDPNLRAGGDTPQRGMKQFKAYIGRESGQVTCINDAFGASVAVFNDFYKPGDIARRIVEHKKLSEFKSVESHFRIVREVSEQEVETLLILAKCNVPMRDGWWYEVIGD
jgi:hypothetical protein